MDHWKWLWRFRSSVYPNWSASFRRHQIRRRADRFNRGNPSGKRLQHSWTNSSGDGGAGWLELSWSNFLGGPWHNQRVRDGSWTLTRLEGKWCFGGSRSRIRTLTHNASGRITLIAEDGTGYDGRLEGPFIYLDSDLGSIEGTMNFKSNRVDWSSGFFWTWCGR